MSKRASAKGSGGGRGGWAELPSPVMALLVGGAWWSRRDSAVLRLVCARWRREHDACLPHLQPCSLVGPGRACSLLEGRFPGVQFVHLKQCRGAPATREEVLLGLGARPNLTRLDVERCALGPSGVQAVGQLEGLRALTLYGCGQVTDDGLTALARLPSLRSLALSFCDQVSR